VLLSYILSPQQREKGGRKVRNEGLDEKKKKEKKNSIRPIFFLMAGGEGGRKKRRGGREMQILLWARLARGREREKSQHEEEIGNASAFSSIIEQKKKKIGEKS